MAPHQPILSWIDDQRDAMVRRLEHWASINSGSRNLQGLKRMEDEVVSAMAGLPGTAERIDLNPLRIIDDAGREVEQPLGRAVRLIKPTPAGFEGLRLFLGIHMDTVYGADHPFQKLTHLEAGALQGPGVADAKGGLVVLLTALRAIERSDLADRIAWEVLINPDEEIGSPGATPLLQEAAKRNDVGLVFEPSLPDGKLISARKGSGNFTLVVRGRSAHAGRDFDAGRNAICALAETIVRLNELNERLPGVTVNVGLVRGGGAVNMVPELAIARFNVRVRQAEEQAVALDHIQRIMSSVAQRDGITANLHGGMTSPPKPLDEATGRLLELAAQAGRKVGIEIGWRESGGVCDGNRLAAAGLPTLDTLGPRGDHLHTDREYVLLDSLAERAKLTAQLIFDLTTDRGLINGRHAGTQRR